jgi:hypothetical protein
MTIMYDVTLRCADLAAVSVLLGTVAGSVELVGIKQALDAGVQPAPAVPVKAPNLVPAWKANDGAKAPVTGRGRYERKQRGISGMDLLMQVLAESARAYSFNEILKRFEAKGFSRNSASPIIYRAIKEHTVRNVGGSMYELVRNPANGAVP